MSISGTADLPLHTGHVPPWLMNRIKNLADAIVKVMVEELGKREVLRRMGDPYWFQAFGCVLGFDWHSSGLTTVVTGALRESVKLNTHGIAVIGGKGAMGIRTPQMICEVDIPEELKIKLIKASKLSAKVDNAVLQDGYDIYHHTIMFTEDGDWAVVQQGMNLAAKYARRYQHGYRKRGWPMSYSSRETDGWISSDPLGGTLDKPYQPHSSYCSSANRVIDCLAIC